MLAVKDLVEEFNLKIWGGNTGLENEISSFDLSRPGWKLQDTFPISHPTECRYSE